MNTIFFSYSHRDEKWRNELEIHLQALRRQGLIETWHDRRIAAGDDVHNAISTHLESASIILLLVSPYFIASNYCYDIEMTRALERHAANQTRVIPVILEPCVWQDLPFGALLATPTDGKPVSKHANPHDAFVDIVKAIRDAIPRKASRGDANIGAASVVAPKSEELVVRSSNLRVRQQFTDEDNQRFLETSFEYMANFFEGSVAEIAARNPNITTQFRRVDASRFDIVIFRRGHELASGTIWLGGDSGMGRGIYYASGIQANSNSYNESLTVTDDGYAQFLKGFGFSGFDDENLSQHGAAEHIWRQVIERLQ
jgi:hypothetical protein